MNARGIAYVSASATTGYGHLRRVLTLRDRLAERGCEVEVVQVANGSAPDVATDVVIVDSYRVDQSFVDRATRSARLGVVIDDLPGRELDADVVHDASVGASRRAGRARDLLLGPRYALLRPEFERDPRRDHREAVRRILITLGGSDPRELTPAIAEHAAGVIPEASQVVILGPLYAGPDLPSTAGREILRAPDDIAGLMRACDVAIAAGGQTLFELCATATPAVAILVAENQLANVAGMERAGAVRGAGAWDDPAMMSRLTVALEELRDRRARAALGARGRTLVDGLGARRTADVIADLLA